MSETVLVAIDGSPLGQRALEYALQKFPDDDLVVLHVVDPVYVLYEAEMHGPTDAEAASAELETRSAKLRRDAEATAADHGPSVTVVGATGKPERRILETVEEYGVDHIVMGSHGRTGVSRLVMGSTAESVMRHAPVPVTVVR